jgi:hypothetical protein
MVYPIISYELARSVLNALNYSFSEGRFNKKNFATDRKQSDFSFDIVAC